MNPPPSPDPGAPVTRRGFLSGATRAAAGGAVLGALPVERFAHAAGSDTLKLALVGCGGRGSGAANQALRAGPGQKLVAMADVFHDKLETSLANLTRQHPDKVDVSEANKFIGFDAYKYAIAAADVAILATPSCFRPLHFQEAVRQGKHIFAEKPLAVDAPGVRRVLAAASEAKKKQLKIGVGLQRRHKQGYLEAAQRIQDGALGEILVMRTFWNSSGGRAGLFRKPEWNELEYQFRNQYYFSWLSGDIHVDQAIHNTDVIHWIKGAYPIRAQGFGGNQVRRGPEYGNLFDHYAIEYEYADGTRLYAHNRHTQGCWNSISEHLTGTRGSADLVNDRNLFVITGPKAWRFRADKPDDPYQLEHDRLFAAIRAGEPFDEAERGALSSMVVIMGRMAGYSGKMIEWDDALNSDARIGPAPEDVSWRMDPPVLPDANGLYALPVPGKTAPV